MGLNFCSSTAIELMGTYHTTNLSMLLPLLITTALAQQWLAGQVGASRWETPPKRFISLCPSDRAGVRVREQIPK